MNLSFNTIYFAISTCNASAYQRLKTSASAMVLFLVFIVRGWKVTRLKLQAVEA